MTYAGLSMRPEYIRSGPLSGDTCNPTSPLRRETHIGYPTDGTRWPASIVQGTSTTTLTTSVTRDRRGEITFVDLPARAMADITIAYDELGNVTSFTPSRRTAAEVAHDPYGYAFTPRDSLLSFTPPAAESYTGPEVHDVHDRPDGRFRSATIRATAGSSNRTITASAAMSLSTGYISEVSTTEGSPPPSGVGASETYDFTRDADGRPTSITGPGGAMGIVYDAPYIAEQSWSLNGTHGVAGRVVRSTSGAGFLMSEGVCFGATACDPTTAGRTIAYGYDLDGLLTSAGALDLPQNILGTAFAGGNPPGETRVSTTDSIQAQEVLARGEMVSRNYYWTPNFATLYGEDICERDTLGRVLARTETTRTKPHHRALVQFYAYSYDAAGRLARYRRWDAEPSVTCATYASTAIRPAVDHTNTYDDQGNRIASPGIRDTLANAADQPEVDSRLYDGAGRLRSRLDAGQTRTYSYDVRGQLRSTTRMGTTASYDYDPAGRLTAVRAGAGAVVEQRFLYRDALHPIAWQRQNISGDCPGGFDTWYFVYGLSQQTPDLAYVDTCNDRSNNAVYRFTFDERGSVRSVINLDSGKSALLIEYDEWGEPTYFGRRMDGEPETFQPFGFAGSIRLADAGLWHMGARDYDSTVGRWTAADPLRLSPSAPCPGCDTPSAASLAGAQLVTFGGGLNQYAYAANDPINRTDAGGRALEQDPRNPCGVGDSLCQLLWLLGFIPNAPVYTVCRGPVEVPEESGRFIRCVYDPTTLPSVCYYRCSGGATWVLPKPPGTICAPEIFIED